jgi:nucleoid-associated protein YgaU
MAQITAGDKCGSDAPYRARRGVRGVGQVSKHAPSTSEPSSGGHRLRTSGQGRERPTPHHVPRGDTAWVISRAEYDEGNPEKYINTQLMVLTRDSDDWRIRTISWSTNQP